MGIGTEIMNEDSVCVVSSTARKVFTNAYHVWLLVFHGRWVEP